MNIENLRVFKEVAKEANITKVAKKLNFVQSNISAKIIRLEQHYGTKLFYRHKHGVNLTSTGKVLLTYVEQVLHLMDAAEKTLKDSRVPSGSLTIGSMETTAAIRLPEILSQYHNLYPDVELSLLTDPTEELIKSAINREIEGAFVAGEIDHPELEKIKVFEEELFLVSKKDNIQSINFEQLNNQTFIVFKSGCFYRKTFEAFLSKKGVRTPKMMELNTLDGVIGCVKAGLGVSLLPKSVIDKVDKKEKIKKFKLPQEFGQVTTSFINHKDIVKTQAFNKMILLLTPSVSINKSVLR